MKLIILIINLEKDINRKEEITKLINQKLGGFYFSFIKAIDGKKLQESEIKANIDQEKRKKLFKRELSLGEIGCLMSHKKAYEALLKSDANAALILEDDAFFDDRLKEFLSHLDELPSDLELLLLGHQRQVYEDGFRIESPYSRRFAKQIGKGILRRLVGNGNGGYGYLLTKKGAKKMLKATQKPFMPVDNYTCNENYINVYAIFPVLIWNNPLHMMQSQTQENFKLKQRSRFRKELKKLSIYLKFLPKSLKKLKSFKI